MEAAILTIGTEILIGQVIDTNSAWIANELNRIGVNVQTIISISDSGGEIKNTVEQLLNKFDLVLVTGGLGPTSDDITRQVLTNIFHSKLILHQPTLTHIENIFAKRNLPLTELNRMQALVPECCDVLSNQHGTAPGMWFSQSNRILVAMPGVPFEMKGIMELHVIPKLINLSSNSVIVHKTIQTFGLPESFLAERLADWEQDIAPPIAVAYLPGLTSIRIRLSAQGSSRAELEQTIDGHIEQLMDIIPDNVFGFEDDTMASVVGEMLVYSGFSLSVAESCTGGAISHLITQVPGASNFFKGGIVAYSNELKENFLGVDRGVIRKFGAVSQQVVEAMAMGALCRFNTDYAIATSGIAGPTGATQSKPIGLIWIAIASATGTISQVYHMGQIRDRNILRGSIVALNLLRLELRKTSKAKIPPACH